MQAITGALAARVRSAAMLLVVTTALALTCAGSAAASTAYSAESAKPHPIPRTGWHGAPVQRPHKPVDDALLSKAALPAGWSAGAVRYGTGYHRLGGSERVREVQRRLTTLGYHTGPVDGLYGPLTRSSVQWFQIKHGLRPTGVVAATTLAALRDPKGWTQRLNAQAKKPPVTAGEPAAVQTRAPKPEPARPDTSGAPTWLLALMALAIVLLSTLLIATRSTLKRRATVAPRPLVRPDSAAPAPQRPTADRDVGAQVLAYVAGQNGEAAEEHEEAIREACDSRGWMLARLVRDIRTGNGRSLGRPGLSFALEELSEGTASRLVVHRLEHIARSVGELHMVLGWFMRTGIALTALDVGLDTGTPEGKTAARSLLSVGDAENKKVEAQTRAGLAAARNARRPAVSDSPELAGRIRSMRARGMTLRGIADTLNREGVPTVRGGAEWRPSSVQSVLGYRRTRTPE